MLKLINTLLINRYKVFLFIFLFVSVCNSQNTNGFEHISTSNGLSQSDVNCIYQDKFGFMWFGTHDGLNRYDGSKFTIFKLDPNNKSSLNSNLIWTISEDKKGNLWIGTTGSGINYLDISTFKFKHFVHKETDRKSLKSDIVRTTFIDSKNRLWVGTDRGIDMALLNKPLDSIHFQHIKAYKDEVEFSQENIYVNIIYEAKNKDILIGTNKGIYKIVENSKNQLTVKSINDEIGIKNTSTKAIVENSFGQLFFGTSSGLFFLDRNTKSKAQFLLGGAVSRAVYHNQMIWVSNQSGLVQLENNSKFKLPKVVNQYTSDDENPMSSLSSTNIKSLFVDRTGIIWVGTNGTGVDKFDPDKKRFNSIQNSSGANLLANNKIRSIFEDSNGTLWVGTDGNGLKMFISNNGKFELKELEPLQNILKVYDIVEIEEAGKKYIIVGGEFSNRSYKIDISNPANINQSSIKKVARTSKSIFSILKDSKDNLWFGTYSGGVYRWLKDGTNEGYKIDNLISDPEDEYSLTSDIIRDIIEDKNGGIWFASSNGISVLPVAEIGQEKPKFKRYKSDELHENGLTQNYILTIFESELGDIWIGTLGGGLHKFIPGKKGNKDKFISYSEADGLPNNVIKGILEDRKNNLWLSTNKGLSKFNPKTETFKNYDVNDGLPSNEFGELARFKRNNGEMIFGSVNGVTKFFPDDIKDNIISAETVFTGFTIFNEPITIGSTVNGRVLFEKAINFTDKIDLKYQENSFSFEFAALHFAASKKNSFAYKLEGFNKDWIYTSNDNRIATYTNLEPGKYVFKVKASNNDGFWDETPAELTINVIPPFWRTTVAYIVYILLFFAGLVAFRRFTVIKTTKKHQLELEHYEKEKNEEVNRIKLEFFTNISHEIRTPLTLIKGPLEYLQKQGDLIASDKVKEQYNLMHKNTDYLMRLVNQLLDFRKLDRGKMNLLVGKGNIVEFVKDLTEPFMFLSQKKSIDFKLNSLKTNIQCWFDTDAMEKILNNLLSNAFKFTPINGAISIEVFDGNEFEFPKNEIVENKDNFVVIQVKDTGGGIPEHRIKYIFERFYVDVGSKRMKNPTGTGIGLSFTKNLVELHKGGIDVVSHENIGTTFYFWIPKQKKYYEDIEGISFYEGEKQQSFISQIDAESHAIGVFDEIVDQNISNSRSKLPVLLVVDDNADIRSFIKFGLSKSYKIYEAENGENGFELAMKILPNIIITDILMPIMDGIEFCEKLKSTQETSHIPVVMLTAKSSQEWEIEGLKIGADEYIRKPFDMEMLDLKLKNILKFREQLRKRFNRDVTLQPNEVTVTSADETFLNRAIEIVEKHMMNTEFSVELLVKEMALSRSNLYLKIKELTGLSSSEFIRNIRLKRAMQLFENSDLSVKEIMYMTGFNTASYFSKCFKKQFGVLPSKYLTKNEEDEELDIE